jgi:hypothetical protein
MIRYNKPNNKTEKGLIKNSRTQSKGTYCSFSFLNILIKPYINKRPIEQINVAPIKNSGSSPDEFPSMILNNVNIFRNVTHEAIIIKCFFAPFTLRLFY